MNPKSGGLHGHFSETIFYALYRWLAWPTLKAALSLLGRFVPKIAQGLELREAVDGRAPWVKALPPAPPTLWIHCASGEFEYAKPVIALLKKQKPATKIVVTFFSPTYADNIRKFNGVDWVVPLPWDSPRDLKMFLDSYRPFGLIVARTDVWPEMALQSRKRGMSSALFSATLTKASGRNRGLGKWATRSTLDQLDMIFCVSQDDVDQFKALGLSHASVELQGDTRYDQVLARLESPKTIRDEIFNAIRASGDLASRDLLICGSTWPEDEDVLIPALAKMKDIVCGVLVPHEPTPQHLAEVEEQLRAHGLSPVRYSSADAAEKMREPSSCLVVDQTGLLAELYLKGRWGFVGGSFKKSVHSVMEPLAAGLVTFVGPLHTNNREAVAFQALKLTSGLSYVTPIQRSQDLVEKIHRLKSLPDSKNEIRSAITARTGSSQALVNWIARDL